MDKVILYHQVIIYIIVHLDFLQVVVPFLEINL